MEVLHTVRTGSKSCGNNTYCCSDKSVALAKGGGGTDARTPEHTSAHAQVNKRQGTDIRGVHVSIHQRRTSLHMYMLGLEHGSAERLHSATGGNKKH